MSKLLKILLQETKKSCEETILRDVNRTFPAHDFFRDSGNGQELLYKVSKAYSVYDDEVGYCQGLSFIAATLLLHLPEEEAFSVMVSIMVCFSSMIREEIKISLPLYFSLTMGYAIFTKKNSKTCRCVYSSWIA